MKEALTLIIVLLMGLFASQSFGDHFNQQDLQLIGFIEERVDTIYQQQPERIVSIQQQLWPIITQFAHSPKDQHILIEIRDYIDNKLTTSTITYVNEAVISARADLF